jgi:hypothetical protein
LTVLAAEIRAAHAAVCAAHNDAAQRAIDAGRALDEARDNPDIPFGGWDRWVEKETDLPKTTAFCYRQLFIAVKQGRSTVNDIAKDGQKAVLKKGADDDTRQRREASRNAVALADGMDLRVGDARLRRSATRTDAAVQVQSQPYRYGAEKSREASDVQRADLGVGRTHCDTFRKRTGARADHGDGRF